MHFDSPLKTGVFLRRYKRFFVDVEGPDGRPITVHCANTGAMRGCSTVGSRCAYSVHGRADRATAGSLELVEVDGAWVGVKPVLGNRLVAEAIDGGRVARWSGFGVRRAEVRQPGTSSRFDLQLRHLDGREMLVEVKSVSWAERGVGQFPDAVSERARRHADDLAAVALAGGRAAIVFCVQRADAAVVRPAHSVDPTYGLALERAAAAGVELVAFGCSVSLAGIELAGELPFELGLG